MTLPDSKDDSQFLLPKAEVGRLFVKLQSSQRKPSLLRATHEIVVDKSPLHQQSGCECKHLANRLQREVTSTRSRLHSQVTGHDHSSTYAYSVRNGSEPDDWQ